jgi:quercetin dioxygenase-like cupin family protein
MAMRTDSSQVRFREEAAGIPGMHSEDTLDIVTVVSGEIYVVLEAGETVLREGDTLVMRGAKHVGAIGRTAR